MENMAQHAITGLQVEINLTPEYEDMKDDIVRVVEALFENMEVGFTFIDAEELSIRVLIPMKTNPDVETSYFKNDPLAAKLIKFRIEALL